MRAQKLSQRGRSPGPVREQNQAVGPGPSKGPSKNQKEHSSHEPVSQTKPAANLHPNQKERPRERPLSVPSQAAIPGLLSPDLQLKAPQARPQSPGRSQSPGQIQKPQSGSNHVSSPAVKLVSGPPRCRSHSPRCRIDVDVDVELDCKDLRAAVSHNSLLVPWDLEATAVDPTNLLSQSFPESSLRSAQLRRGSYSPTSNSGNFLQIPQSSPFLVPRGHNGRSCENLGLNALRGSSSDCDLSASASGDVFNQNLAGSSRMRRHSADHRRSPVSWLNISPRASPPYSCSSSPTSPGQSSLSTLSPPFSPEYFEPSMTYCGSSPPSSTHLLLSKHSSVYLRNSLASTPHCSPYSSPFGSQTQICISSHT